MIGIRPALWAALLVVAPATGFAGTPPFDAPTYLAFERGENDIAIEPNANAVSWPADFTLEAWVYVTAPSPFGLIAGRAAANRGSDPYYHAVLAFEGNDGLTPSLVQSTGAPGTYRDVKATSPVALHTWVHLAGVREGGTLRLYVDGVQVATQPSPGPVQPNPGVPFAIGAAARADGSGAQCCGASLVVRNVRLWRRALAAGEVQSSAATNAYVTPPADLLRSWPLDDGGGSVLRSDLPGAAALRAGASDGSSRPQWREAAFLRPVFTPQSTSLGARSTGVSALWPVRIGAQTHFLATQIIWPPTVPASETAVSVFSPGAGGLVHSSDTRLVGQPATVHARDFANLDVNGDGREDIVIADHGTDTAPFPGGIARLFVQQADGRLADETATRLPGPARFHHNIAAGDFDRDGDDDIFFCSFSQFSSATASTVMVNDGSGRFAAAASGHLPAAISAGELRCLASRPIDVDKDGDLDLAVALYRPAFFEQPQEPRDRLLINDGSGGFTFAPETALPLRPIGPASQTVAMAVADIDADGRDDLLIGSTLEYRGKPVLQYLRNLGDSTFEDRSHEVPNDWPVNTWIYGIVPRDFDGDGRLDLFVQLSNGLGPQPPTSRLLELLLNRGRGWVPVGESAGIATLADDGSRAWPADADGDGDLDIVWVRHNREGGQALQTMPFPAALPRPAQVLASGVAQAVRLQPGEAHERLYIDVPARATGVRFQLASSADVDLYVARVPFDDQPGIEPAPARALADARSTGAGGNEQILLEAGALAPGRWYVTPLNADVVAADVTVTATITTAAPGAPLAAGHFFNPSRSGHGISYEYVAGQRVLIWYAFLADGTPVWYYAQAAAPSPNLGAWSADLLHFQWHGERTTSRRVGSVTVAETGKNGSGEDTIVLSWNLDGESGSETMQRLGGTGCPAGHAGNNGMWFAPSLSGYGYTVTYFPDYEFMPVYIFDRWGNPVWVAAEKGGFSSADSDLPLNQVSGFCPTCDRDVAPSRSPAGTLRRRFTGSAISGLGLNATLGGWLEGTWVQDRPVVLLTDPSPCTVP